MVSIAQPGSAAYTVCDHFLVLEIPILFGNMGKGVVVQAGE